MKALFLDRDGIVNEVVMRDGLPASPRSISELRIIPKAIELINQAKKLGFATVLITNQPDISRKKMSRYQLHKIHQAIQEELHLDGIEVCTSSDNNHYLRKPNPGMLLNSAKKLGLDLSSSYFVGDSPKDMEAGKRAGVKTILLQTDYNHNFHGMGDFNCNSFDEIISILTMEKTCSFKNIFLRFLKLLRKSISMTLPA